MGNYIVTLKKNFTISNLLMTFLIIFLPIFSFGIFGPTEIFFANHFSFGVVFDEFGWTFLKTGCIVSVLIAIVTLFLPQLLQKIFLTILWMISLAGYVQTMFLNTGLDQIGATTDGYIPTQETILKDSLIWLAIFVAAILIVIKSKENWKKPLFITSFILILTQGVAYGTLFLTAPEEAFTYAESEVQISGEKQYTVSSKENVIVIILDALANRLFESAVAEHPEITNCMSDFTYYNNSDCNYYGTFPSVTHLLTGYEYDPTLPVNDWIYDSWHNDATIKFYNDLHAANYQVNVFCTEPTLLSGTEPLTMVEGYIDNLITLNHNIIIDYPLLYETLLTMSCYRFMPDYFKPYFDVPNTQYTSIVSYPDNTVNYANPNFYADLLEKGLSLDDSSNYFIVHHLNGIHECINDENCVRINEADGDYVTTIQGLWVLLEEYFNQLKDLGVYDSSTIILTADHGSEYNSQNAFFIKEPFVSHDTMQITNAPITLDELLPTIADITLEESDYLGKTIYDFKENELRERTLYVRAYDENYPKAYRFDTKTVTSLNVYHLYTYTGDHSDYLHLYENGIYTTIPFTEYYY